MLFRISIMKIFKQDSHLYIQVVAKINFLDQVTVSHKLGGGILKEFYKLDKFLFENEKYKNLKLNSKITYCILKYMLDENINVKSDINGDKYIENARIYLMKKLNITKNTITAIYKELINAGLIEEKWIEVGKANIVYIKNWESKEQEANHNICEKKKEATIYKAIEKFTIDDLAKADSFLVQNNINCSQYELNKILNKLNFNGYTYIEKNIITNALEYVICENKNEIGKINNEVIKIAIEKTKKYPKREDEKIFAVEVLIREILKEF